MLNTFNQSMLKALQRMRRGGQYAKGGSIGTGPLAEVSSNYQPAPSVNQRHFGTAFSQARQSGLKTFDFKGKSYTTDMRSNVGKQTAQKAIQSQVRTSISNAQTIPQIVGANGNSVPVTGTPAKGKNVNFLLPNRPIKTQTPRTYDNGERVQNMYDAGKTFLDLRGKEKQFAPLKALDNATTVALKEFGMPVYRTITGKGSTSDKVQTALSVLPYTKPLKYAKQLAGVLKSKIPGTTTKVYPMLQKALNVGTQTTKALPPSSKASKPIVTPYYGKSSRTFYMAPQEVKALPAAVIPKSLPAGITKTLKKARAPKKTTVKSTNKLFN